MVDWIDLAPHIEPMKEWLRTATGKVVTFGRAPSGGKPPFTVLQLISDPRLLLTMDGGSPVEVTWQLDYMGENPLHALALSDLGDKAMVTAEPPELPGAMVIVRVAVGDRHGPDRASEGHFYVQSRHTWTLIPTA
jgi:hypothetical protein